jgi:tetratricopeptide (TPR) repeat protein
MNFNIHESGFYPCIFVFIFCMCLGIPAVQAANGQELYLAGDYSGAVEKFTSDLAGAKEADRASILNNIGTSYMGLGDLKKAKEYYQNAVTTDPAYGKGWTNLGVLQEKLGDQDAALDSFEKVTTDDPMVYADAMVKKGTLLTELGKLAEAETTFMQGEQYATGSTAADIYTGIGAIAFIQKKSDLAERNFLKAIDADPSGAVLAYTNLGVLKVTQEDYDGARKLFKTAISNDHLAISQASEFLKKLDQMKPEHTISKP